MAAADIPRFAKLGVIASQQPIHAALGDANQAVPKGPWPDAIGPERASRAWAWKSILTAGGRLTFGSDWPVCLMGRPLLTWVGMLKQIIATRPAADQTKLWSGNAAKFYGVKTA